MDDFVQKNWDTSDGLPGMTITSIMIVLEKKVEDRTKELKVANEKAKRTRDRTYGTS